jgi:hypothetical protein
MTLREPRKIQMRPTINLPWAIEQDELLYNIINNKGQIVAMFANLEHAKTVCELVNTCGEPREEERCASQGKEVTAR